MGSSERNKQLFDEAQKYLVGGVSSPVRAFKAVGGTPLIIKKGCGSYIEDEDGKQYIDFVGSWGPLILGHAFASVNQSLKEAVDNGTSFGTSTEIEIKLAQFIRKFFPSIEKIRFVNSGTEATMSAIRLARGFTGRKYIIKFSGCYHGHSDGLLIKAGSGATTLGIPDSPGVPDEIAQLTIPLEFNDTQGLEQVFSEHRNTIAAVILEPIAGNMGVIPAQPYFLETLRQLCDHNNTLLIFDEVMTGFRVAKGGAQQYYNIIPDLTCLGKIIGGGLPVGAYGGKKVIMDILAPNGPVYQAGTLSGNPLAMTAGYETLKALDKPEFYEQLENKCLLFDTILAPEINKNHWNICFQRVGSMATLFFQKGPISCYKEATQSDTSMYKEFFHYLLQNGIYFPPSQFEAFFLSAAHTDADIKLAINTILSYCYEKF